jgi:hypothetical protein
MEFVNNMYVYPEFVQLRSKINLQIMVEIVESVDEYPWPNLRVILHLFCFVCSFFLFHLYFILFHISLFSLLS